MKEIATAISNRNRRVTPLETIAAVKAAGFEKVFINGITKTGRFLRKNSLNTSKLWA